MSSVLWKKEWKGECCFYVGRASKVISHLPLGSQLFIGLPWVPAFKNIPNNYPLVFVLICVFSWFCFVWISLFGLQRSIKMGSIKIQKYSNLIGHKEKLQKGSFRMWEYYCIVRYKGKYSNLFYSIIPSFLSSTPPSFFLGCIWVRYSRCCGFTNIVLRQQCCRVCLCLLVWATVLECWPRALSSSQL